MSENHLCLNFMDHGISVLFSGVADLLSGKNSSVGFTSYNFEGQIVEGLIRAGITVEISIFWVPDKDDPEQKNMIYKYKMTKN